MFICQASYSLAFYLYEDIMAGKIYTVSQLNKYLRQQFDDDIILQNIMLKEKYLILKSILLDIVILL